MKLVVITGTGTEVGKTWVGVSLLSALRCSGLGVAARKPGQSFAPGSGPTDAELLALATGEDPAEVCPPHRSYPVPMAPPMAAASLGLPVPSIASLVDEIHASWPSSPVDFGVVEGAGGVAAPQADDGDTRALIDRLRPDLVVLVADAGLGTINLVRLSVAALAGWPTVVHLNRYDPGSELHVRNLAWLSERDGFDVTTDTSALVAVVATGVVGDAGVAGLKA
jgi:dethiobiotin synthetase